MDAKQARAEQLRVTLTSQRLAKLARAKEGREAAKDKAKVGGWVRRKEERPHVLS